MISRRGVGEEVGRVQARAVPQLVEIAVELIRPGFGDVVDLRRAVAPLIDGVGKGVDGHFRNGVEAEDEVGGEPAVQIGQRIVGFQAVDDVAVGKRRQAVELDVAVSVRAAHKIIAAARRVDEGARGKLQRVGEIAAGIGKIFERWALRVVEVLAFSGLRMATWPVTSILSLIARPAA